MRILGNAVPGIKILAALKWFQKNKKEIFDAREKEDYETERKYILKSTSDWGKNLCRELGIEIDVEGRENLPDSGPAVFIANHQGYADIPVMCAVLDRFQFGFVAKEELRRIPLYGKAILDIRSVLMNRDDTKASVRSIFEGIDLIKKGFSLCIFPEGTRSRSEEMGEFHKGSFKLALKPKVPVIPVSINGTYRVFEATGKITGTKVKVVIHPAIQTANLDREQQNRLPEQVEETVRKGIK